VRHDTPVRRRTAPSLEEYTLSPEFDHDAYEIWGKGCRLGFSKINADDYYWYMTFDSAPNKNFSAVER